MTTDTRFASPSPPRAASNSRTVRVNLGAGRYPLKDFVNVDFAPLPGIDLLCDLDHERFPFEDESVDFILLSEAFEHLAHRDHVWREIHRILKVGGRIEIRAHYGGSNGDPFHLAPLTRRSIEHFTNGYIGRFHQVGHETFRNLGGFPWWHWRKSLHREPPCLPGLMSGLEMTFVLEKEA